MTSTSAFDEESERPVNVGTVFEYGITKLHAYWLYDGVDAGTACRWDFYGDGTYLYGEENTFDLTSGHARQGVYNLGAEPLSQGTYERSPLRYAVNGS